MRWYGWPRRNEWDCTSLVVVGLRGVEGLPRRWDRGRRWSEAIQTSPRGEQLASPRLHARACGGLAGAAPCVTVRAG